MGLINFTLKTFLFIGIFSISTASINAASLKLSPQSTSLIRGCSYSIEIKVDPAGESVNAAEFQLTYNPSAITIQDESSQRGIQIESSDEFPVVLGNEVSGGIINFSAGTPPLKSIVSEETLATINFDVNESASSLSMQFLVDGFGAQYTTDSNIADSNSNQDILTSVVNGSYSLIQGFCENIGPNITFDDPESYAFDIDIDGNFVITINDSHDNASGVDINSVRIYINGVLYTPDSSGVTYSGDSSSYTFVIDPAESFEDDQGISIIVEASDFAGNASRKSTVMETRNICPIDPDVICRSYDVSVSDSLKTGGVLDISVSDEELFDIAVAGSTAALVLGGLPILLSLLSLPGALFKFLSVLLGRKQDKPWGIIKDAITGKPISFAICELYAEGSSFKLNQVVSDLEGRYGFSVSPGSYRIEVKKSEYKTFTTSFEIKSGSDTYIYDVEMSPVASDHSSTISLTNKIKTRASKIYGVLTKWIFIIGLILSTVSLILDQSILNILISILYVFILIIILIPRLKNRSKFATIVSTKTNLRIPFAQIKIFDNKSFKLVDTKTTNQDGYFDYYGEPGKFAIMAIARGYKFPSDKNTFPKTGPNQSMLEVDLSRGGNKLTIFMDPMDVAGAKQPMESAQQMANTGTPTNLNSPFS